jgi:YD repeat-containing protein
LSLVLPAAYQETNLDGSVAHTKYYSWRQATTGNCYLNSADGHNNGRISQSIDGVGQTVNYTYDSLNRLATAQATNGAWGQSYSYDGFGNLESRPMRALPSRSAPRAETKVQCPRFARRRAFPHE